MSVQPGGFVGTLTGSDGQTDTVTIRLHAGAGHPHSGLEPAIAAQFATDTVIVDGTTASITVGGHGHIGSITVLDANGEIAAEFEGSPMWLRLWHGAKQSIELTASGVLTAANNKGTQTVRLDANGGSGTAGVVELSNGEGKQTVRLDGAGGSGWFGGPGSNGDVLVFASDAPSTDSANAAVWIQGKTGDIVLGATNADCAEEFEVEEGAKIEPGALVTLTGDGKLALAIAPYDSRVAGVVSGAGGLRPGIVLGRSKDRRNRWPISLSGKAFCMVDARSSPVAVGDLLTSSSMPGHAMRAVDRGLAFGAVIGKALKPLPHGTGLLPVLIALQ